MHTSFAANILTLVVLCTSTTAREQTSCTLPPGQNVIQNGGFEASPNSITPWVSKKEAPLSDAPKHAGIVMPGYRSAQAYGYTTTTGVGAMISQAFTACNHTWYTVSWTRKYTVFGNDTINSNQVGGYLESTDTIEDFLDTGTNDTWVTRKQNFYIPSTMNSSIMYQSSINDQFADPTTTEGGSFALDDFSLVPLGTLTVKKNAPNLVLNGDFETGSLGPWTTATKKCRVTRPGFGNSSFALYCRNLKALQTAFVTQNFATIPFQQYVLTYEYMTGSFGNLDVQIEDFPGFSQGQGGIRNIYAGTAAPTNGRWVHHVAYFIANSNNTALSFAYIGQDAAYDNISVREANR